MTLSSALAGCPSAAKAEKHRFANMDQFREFVIAALKRRGVDRVENDPSDPAQLKIAVGGEFFTCNLMNSFGYLKANPDEDADQVIEALINTVTTRTARVVSDDNIVAVIRSRDYVDNARSMGLEILSEPLGADLQISYMVDEPDAVSSITSRDVPNKDMRALREIALRNLRPWIAKVSTNEELELGVYYVVEGNTMLSTSLILLDEFWTSIGARFSGDVLIALPRRDGLFVFDGGNPEATAMARRAIDVTTAENFNLLSDKLYARRNGAIVFATD